MKATTKPFLILFVEGETEKEFYEALLAYYKANSEKAICGYKIYNMKGIGRFETKTVAKLKLEIMPKYLGYNLSVICCYDTDVFDLAQKPPVNWSNLRQKIKELGIEKFEEVKAKQMIEDWFLKDLKGLCEYLKVPQPKELKGKNGNEKMKALFKMGKKPKVYQKGSNSHKFIPSLSMKSIRDSVKSELLPLESILKVQL